MPHKPGSTEKLSSALAVARKDLCRFSLNLDVRLGSPLNAGKIEGKR